MCIFLRFKLGGEIEMSFIEVKNISKTFKVAKRKKGFKATVKNFIKRDYTYIDAVKNISFDIDKGSIVGYIGPNGAGKSTTIKILSGILTPDVGHVRINGIDPFKNREKYVLDIGCVFGSKSQLWWDIPAIDTFDLLKDIYKLSDQEYEKTKNELIDLLNLKDIINIPVRQLSLGSRMRLEIAASLIHKPKILFLDEPTIGLDAVSKEIVRDFIKKINKLEKTTIILTTHDMSDIEALANRIILIGKGEIMYDGTLNNLKKKFGNIKKVKIYSKEKIRSVKKKGIQKIESEKGIITFYIDINILSISDFLKYISEKISILDVDIESDNIDNIIVKLYENYGI